MPEMSKGIYNFVDNETLKKSIHIHKLYKWFAENYPNEYLYLEVNQT